MADEPTEWTIEEYETPSGGVPVATFLTRLKDERAKHEAAALLLLLKARGNTLRAPRSEPIGDGIFELRGHQVRIFYGFKPGRRIVLLDGIIKKQDTIPADALRRIRQYRRDLDDRERK
jgi:putative component of toxin-antitoxin plasmid stabilization module